MIRRVAIVGAGSGIARAVARELAAHGTATLVLGARRPEELEADARDLEVRHGARVELRAFEARDFASHAKFVEGCFEACGGHLDGFVLAHGVMVDAEEAERSLEATLAMIEVNYSSYVSLLSLAAPRLASAGGGFLCALSSVAGDRGRPRNFPYGATKAALSTYLEGLTARWASRGVAVITIKPGVVDTPMTYGRATFPFPARPERVARDVVRGIARRRPVVYTPAYWRWVMAAVRFAPRSLLSRLRL